MAETNYYAYVDKADGDQENIFLEFHCLRAEPGELWLQLGLQEFRNNLLERPVPVIALNTFPGAFRDLFNAFEEIGDLESNWYNLAINDQQLGLAASIFADENAEAAAIYVNRLEALPPEISRQLEEKTSMDNFENADKDQLQRALNGKMREQAEYVAVYQVGQGNANAICNKAGMPLLYFDLGGGCFQNKKTYPKALRFCFTTAPAIVLSHWDTDHYESAKRDKSYQAKTWIVPRQNPGPAHLRFLLQVDKAGTVLIWPPFLTLLPFRFGTIVLCNHSQPGKKNHTGLAMQASLQPSRNSIRQVLLPADAAYCFMPAIGTGAYDGLVATHHGAQFDHRNNPVPFAMGAGAIAYSYGHENTYKHPKDPAIAAHQHLNRKDATGGHIALCDAGPCRQGCEGTQCDLVIAQYY